MIRGDLECHASLSLFFHFRSLILSFSFSVVAHCFISPFLFQASASLIFSLFYVFFFWWEFFCVNNMVHLLSG